jgi:L-ascorbate metabolism protein UlaG (beta-lactamase superfamily)
MKLNSTTFIKSLALPALAVLAAPAAADLTSFGHSAFRLTTPSGKVILIDPWIANPGNPSGKEHLASLDKADLILLTHGHNDHIGNSVEIARQTGAKLVASFDLIKAMVKYRGYPAEQATLATAGAVGGTIPLLEGEVEIAFTHAVHGSDLEIGADLPGAGNTTAGGEAGGFVIMVKNGPTIYHAGDTDVFSDMALIGQRWKPGVAILPIGDKFTMGPAGAAMAARLVGSTTVIPMHYGTFPALRGTPGQFAEELKKQQVAAKMVELKPGQTIADKAL